MIEGEALGENAYKMTDYFGDIRKSIWTELSDNTIADTYRRNLQRTHLDVLNGLLNEDPPALPSPEVGKFLGIAVNLKTSDIRLYVRGELEELKKQLSTNRSSDRLMKMHIQDCLARIENILNPD